jgi:dTDP-4-amino-4,6-dideoxygalactose transaminase
MENVSAIQVKTRNESAHHLYPIKINFDKIQISRNELMEKLRRYGIITQVHYIPIPLQPYYKSLGYHCENLPNTLNHYFQILSLPIYPKLSRLKQRKVVRKLREVLENNY